MTVSVKKCLDAAELNTGNYRVDSLWVRIKGKANKANILERVCYRLANQDEEVGKVIYLQLAEVT